MDYLFSDIYICFLLNITLSVSHLEVIFETHTRYQAARRRFSQSLTGVFTSFVLWHAVFQF